MAVIHRAAKPRPSRVGLGDRELVLAARAGDKDAFATLAARHQRRAGAVVLALLGSPHEAEDVVQDALVRAYHELDRLRDPALFGAWLRGIALNLARMRIRARRRASYLELIDLDERPGSDGIDEQLAVLDRARAVELAVAQLPPSQREVLLSHELDGLSCVELAARMGASAGAVRARLHRARRRLRVELQAFAPVKQEEMRMVEMEIYDVLVRVPAHGGPGVLSAPQAIVLRERDGDRALPILVGSVEAGSLALHRGGATAPRPMTIDLVGHLLDVFGARVERVTVTSLREGTFYAFLRVAGADVDARPSDAINIAVRAGAPIAADPSVLDQAAVPVAELAERLEEILCGDTSAGEAGEWQSLSPELVLDAWRPWREPQLPAE